MTMQDEPFDDAPQWYWAAGSSRGSSPVRLAGDRFVIASGQRLLWDRVRGEVDAEEQCAWMAFGPKDGVATLAHCFRLFLTAREVYGANLNRVVLELAQVPAFAQFVRERPERLGETVSNPLSLDPPSREPYDYAIERQLGNVVGQTLGLPDEWWVE
ncbi:MAG: hypothetical protein ACRYGP_29965 [Janthinobacterium lividum]